MNIDNLVIVSGTIAFTSYSLHRGDEAGIDLEMLERGAIRETFAHSKWPGTSKRPVEVGVISNGAGPTLLIHPHVVDLSGGGTQELVDWFNRRLEELDQALLVFGVPPDTLSLGIRSADIVVRSTTEGLNIITTDPSEGTNTREHLMSPDLCSMSMSAPPVLTEHCCGQCNAGDDEDGISININVATSSSRRPYVDADKAVSPGVRTGLTDWPGDLTQTINASIRRDLADKRGWTPYELGGLDITVYCKNGTHVLFSSIHRGDGTTLFSMTKDVFLRD